MVFFLIFPRKQVLHFMPIVSNGDNLHEMSKPVFSEKQEKYILKCRLLKFLPRVLSVNRPLYYRIYPSFRTLYYPTPHPHHSSFILITSVLLPAHISKIVRSVENNVDPDQTPRAASDQSLHCFLRFVCPRT